eukprot:gene2133-2831_t
MAHTRIATQRVLVNASSGHEIVAIDHDNVTPVVFATRADAGVQRDLFCLFRDFMTNGTLQGTPVSDTTMDCVCAVVHPHNGMFNELDIIKTARHDIYTNALRRLTYSPECFTADDRQHVRWFRRHGVVYLHAFADLARITECETMRSRTQQFLRVGRDALNAHARYDEYVSTVWSVWAFWVPPTITEMPLILADENFRQTQRARAYDLSDVQAF